MTTAQALRLLPGDAVASQSDQWTSHAEVVSVVKVDAKVHITVRELTGARIGLLRTVPPSHLRRSTRLDP